MSDHGGAGGGITELQLLEQQIAIWKRVGKGVDRAPRGSELAPQIVTQIMLAAEQDGFVVNPEAAAGAAAVNQYHSNVKGAGGMGGGEGGCCVIA